jgi:hypothetical protein
MADMMSYQPLVIRTLHATACPIQNGGVYQVCPELNWRVKRSVFILSLHAHRLSAGMPNFGESAFGNIVHSGGMTRRGRTAPEL